MLIKFNQAVVIKIVEAIKDCCDFADMLNDLNRIEVAQRNLQFSNNQAVIEAGLLDQELYQKYPSIGDMLSLANMLTKPLPNPQKQNSPIEAISSNLRQDYYGILFGAALKKQIISGIEEYIEITPDETYSYAT